MVVEPDVPPVEQLPLPLSLPDFDAVLADGSVADSDVEMGEPGDDSAAGGQEGSQSMYSSSGSLADFALGWPARLANAALFTNAMIGLQNRCRLSDSALGFFIRIVRFVVAAVQSDGMCLADLPRNERQLFAMHQQACIRAGVLSEPLMGEVLVCTGCFKLFRHEPNSLFCVTCGTALFTKSSGIPRPLRTYRIALLSDVARRFMQMPVFHKNIKFPFNRTVEQGHMCDVYDGLIWKQMADDGYLKPQTPYNLAVSIYFDFLPKGRWRNSSHGVMVLLVQNLPYELRFSMIFRVDVAFIQGPNKPADMLPFYEDIAAQLRHADTPGILVNSRSGPAKVVRMRLHSILGDHPAVQEMLGLSGTTGTFACRMCKQRTVVNHIAKKRPRSLPYRLFLEGKGNPDFFRTREQVYRAVEAGDQSSGVNLLSPLLPLLPGPQDSRMPLLAAPTDPMHCFASIGKRIMQLILCRPFGPLEDFDDDFDDDDDDDDDDDPRNASRDSKAKIILQLDEQGELVKRLTLLQCLLPSGLYEALPWEPSRLLKGLKASQRLLQLRTCALPMLYRLVSHPAWAKRVSLIVFLRDIATVCTQQVVQKDDLDLLSARVDAFLRHLEEHFGDSETSLYMHGLLHLRDCLEHFGTGPNMNVFRLERHLLDIRLMASNGKQEATTVAVKRQRIASAVTLNTVLASNDSVKGEPLADLSPLSAMPPSVDPSVATPAHAHFQRIGEFKADIGAIQEPQQRAAENITRHRVECEAAEKANTKFLRRWTTPEGIPLCGTEYKASMFSMMYEDKPPRWKGLTFVSFLMGCKRAPEEVHFGLIQDFLPQDDGTCIARIELWDKLSHDKVQELDLGDLETTMVTRSATPPIVCAHSNGILEPLIPFPVRSKVRGTYVNVLNGLDPIFMIIHPPPKYRRPDPRDLD